MPLKKSKAQDAAGFIFHTLGDRPTQSARDWVKSQVLGVEQRYKILVLACCLIGVVAMFVAYGMPVVPLALTLAVDGAFIGAAIGFVKLFSLRQKLGSAFSYVLDEDCDPQTFADRYLAYIESLWPHDLVVPLWNYCRGLRWQGRWDDAQRLMDAYAQKHGVTSGSAAFCYHQVRAYCAYDQRDAASMIDEVHALQALDTSGVSPTFVEGVSQLVSLANILTLEDGKDYDQVFEAVEGIFDRVTPVQRVEFALHLALCAPSRSQAMEWLGYTTKHGGTTWCLKEAKRMRQQGPVALG